MKTYPGLPEPDIDVVLDYEASRDHYDNQAEFFIASLHLCGNTGTYVDSPCHRFRGAADLSVLPLERLAHVPVLVVGATAVSSRSITHEIFRGCDLRGRAVLVRTEWSRHWRTERYFDKHPFLTADACDCLLDGGAEFVGIDSLNIDDTGNPARPAHTKLLGAGVPVCEHMTNLGSISDDGGYLHAVPIAWKGGASFPVRAYVMF